MKNLRYLDISYAMLMGDKRANSIMEQLPSSLEFFTLRFAREVNMGDWRLMDKLIMTIADEIGRAHQEGLLPHLKAVELMLFEDDSKHPIWYDVAVPSFNIEHTRSVLRDQGVHFDVSLHGYRYFYEDHDGKPLPRSSRYLSFPKLTTSPETSPPSDDTIRALERLFPGFLRSGPAAAYKDLSASTRVEPHIIRDEWVTEITLPRR